MKTRLMTRGIRMAKYLAEQLKRKRHPLFPGLSVRELERGFSEHEEYIRTIYLDWEGCPYEIVLKRSVNPKFCEPGTTSTVTGIALPRYPENPIASDLVERIFNNMFNNDSDYKPSPHGVHRHLGRISLFKKSPVIYVEPTETVNGQRKDINHDKQITKVNIVARRIITSYFEHKKGLLDLLEEVDRDYPVTLDEAVNFVRKHRLPLSIADPSNNSHVRVDKIYESSDPLSDQRYCNYIPPCGGIAIFLRSVLLNLIPEGDKLLRDYSFFREIEPELDHCPIRQRYLVINGILQRDPKDSTEQDFVTRELPELLQKYKTRYLSSRPN